MTPASQQKGPSELSCVGGIHRFAAGSGMGWGGCRKNIRSFVLPVVVWVQPSTGSSSVYNVCLPGPSLADLYELSATLTSGLLMARVT